MVKKKNSLGNLFYDVRTYYGIKRKTICHNLINEQTYYRYEKNELEPDGILFACLWERMGLSLTRASILYSEEEMKWYCLKYMSYEAIRKRNSKELLSIIHMMEQMPKGINRIISLQWIEYMKYALDMLEGWNMNMAYHHIRKSVMYTMIDPLNSDLSEERLDGCEIQLISAYFGMEYRLHPENKSIIYLRIEQLKNNIKNNIPDKILQSISFSRVVSLEIHIFGECRDIEYIIDRHTEINAIYDLPFLLNYAGSIPDLKKVVFYRKWGEVLNEIYANYYKPYEYREELIYVTMPHIYISNDFIRRGRINNGMTQEGVSEGICEPETYSRIESGKRNAHKNNLKRIINKLDLEWGYSQGIIITDSYQCMIKRMEFENALYLNLIDDCDKILNYLEQNLDLSIVQNKQYCEANKAGLLYIKNIIDAKEYSQKLERLLELTCGRMPIERYYSPQEETLLLMLVKLLRQDLNQPYEAKVLIEEYKKNEKRKYIPNEGRILQFNRILSGVYCDLKNWKKEGEIASEALTMIFKTNDAEMIEQFLDLLAESIVNEKHDYVIGKEMLINAVYLADLYGAKDNAASLRTLIEKKIEKGYRWY